MRAELFMNFCIWNISRTWVKTVTVLEIAGSLCYRPFLGGDPGVILIFCGLWFLLGDVS